MYKYNPKQTNRLNNTSNLREGERIEVKVDRVTTQNEPIKDGAPPIYTERKEGVLPGYDIRTDRFEIAVEAMDKVTKSKLAKRDTKVIELNADENNQENSEAKS